MNNERIIHATQVNNFILNQFNGSVGQVINHIHGGMPAGGEQPVSEAEPPMPVEEQVADGLSEEDEPAGNVDNHIFIKARDGWQLDVKKLKTWIHDNFLPNLHKRYDWFALWRVLADHRLIAQGEYQTTKFVEQMTKWFGEAQMPCKAKSVNLFKNGYLGDTPYYNWNKAMFKDRRNSYEQTMGGYDRLERLCDELGGKLKAAIDGKQLRL